MILIKKTTYTMLILLLFISVSCNKEKEITEIEKAEKSLEKRTDNSSPYVNLKAIEKKAGVLQFESMKQFTNSILQLQKECNKNTEDYCSPLFDSGLTELEINQKAQKDGFDQFKPISDFEKSIQFKSLYSILRLEEKEWFKSDELDENLDPFANIERYEAVFCNQEGIVSIAGKEMNMNENLDVVANKTNAPRAYHSKNHFKWGQYLTHPYKMRGNAGPRWFHAISSTTLYTKWGGNWYLYMSRVSASVTGKVHTIQQNNTCSHYSWHPPTTVPYKNSLVWWSAYVYNLSGHGNQSNKGSQWNENIIKSQHVTWGRYFNHAF